MGRQMDHFQAFLLAEAASRSIIYCNGWATRLPQLCFLVMQVWESLWTQVQSGSTVTWPNNSICLLACMYWWWKLCQLSLQCQNHVDMNYTIVMVQGISSVWPSHQRVTLWCNGLHSCLVRSRGATIRYLTIRYVSRYRCCDTIRDTILHNHTSILRNYMF